jgi:transposase-like protein
MAKRKYSPELKAEVVAQYKAGDRWCAQVARDLDINYQTLVSWVQAARASEPSAGGGLSMSESEELKRLRTTPFVVCFFAFEVTKTWRQCNYVIT